MKAYNRLALFATLLAFAVVLMGAYTRLTDAGLGCPDWPGCYGELTVPATEQHVEEKHYLDQRPLEPHKAWNEMIHRYIAGALGLLILTLAIWAWIRRDQPYQPVWLPTALVPLVVFQAILGMWTVTWQLKPVVVMGHLLGGFATLALLFLLVLRSRGNVRPEALYTDGWKRWAGIGLGVLVLQIALGGWTSTNYAALACPDFPLCQYQLWPNTDFGEAFVLWRGLGVNYEFGVLDNPARTAIHLTHRIGAIITLLVIGFIAVGVIRSSRLYLAKTGWLIGILLIVQISLGIANVVLTLPLAVAVAHNGVAALLLLSLVLLNYQLWQRPL